MDQFGALVGRIAEQYGAALVRTRVAFDAVLEHTPPTDWAEDRVYPGLAGHTFVALESLRAVGLET